METASTPALMKQVHGNWPVAKNATLDWLMLETRNQRFIDNILVEMCERLIADGVPVARTTLHMRTLNPQWLGARMLWRRGQREADLTTFGFGVEETSQYAHSPIKQITDGAAEVRWHLEKPGDPASDHSLYRDLVFEGLTDYVAWPIDHTLGRRQVVTFATDLPGGFEQRHLVYLRDLVPALALVSEIRIKNRLARTLLETYVGPHASEAILAGATSRGSGTTVEAAILICDLRDFTAISDAWPRDDVIELLNGYFDAMCVPIERHGGEILKFMGDGLLAIFPLAADNACLNLIKAINEAELAMASLNAENLRMGRLSLSYGIGVHVGEVMYGNIGSRTRLDFTVIGPAVNIASRIESLTKVVHRPVLFSKAFANMIADEYKPETLGFYSVKGMSDPIEVLALPST